MYHLGPCILGDHHPRWVYVGLATLTEKHAPVEGDLSFRFRSNWRSPDTDSSVAPVDLQHKLTFADDQGFLRSFFLFLYDQNYLKPFITNLRNGKSAHDALVNATGLAFDEIEPAWRFWHANEHQRIPILPEAKPLIP